MVSRLVFLVFELVVFSREGVLQHGLKKQDENNINLWISSRYDSDATATNIGVRCLFGNAGEISEKRMLPLS